MIMVNTIETEKKKALQDKKQRIFKKIRDNAQPFWDEIFYDHTSKIARGLLSTKGDAYRTELSYDEDKKYISFLSIHFSRTCFCFYSSVLHRTFWFRLRHSYVVACVEFVCLVLACCSWPVADRISRL